MTDATPATTYVGKCSAAEQVTPALNANLISNGDASKGSTPYSTAAFSNYPYSTDPSLSGYPDAVPDCWTAYSNSNTPYLLFSSMASSYGGATTGDPKPSADMFYGGLSAGAGPVVGDQDWGTQLIPLGSINPGGQYYELSGYLGGYAAHDTAGVTVTFEDASGRSLGTGEIGPVTAAERNNVSGVLAETNYGKVPTGATQALVTVTFTAAYAGSEGAILAYAENLSLVIGSDAAPPPPTPKLTFLSVGAPTGSDGSLYRPGGVSVANGNIYVSNTGDNVVADVVSGATRIVTGSYEGSGESGDGGPADLGTLYQPTGTAVDNKGDLFIADSEDNVVREVHAGSGIITDFAGDPNGMWHPIGVGGKATQAELDSPEAVAVNSAGDVFVADTGDNRVDEVLPNGQIEPFAGTGTPGYAGDGGAATHAKLNQPNGLAVDSDGNVYIADTANDVIRRVDAKTGAITTVAGNHAGAVAANGGGFGGDGGPATSALLNHPAGVALDGAGDLFIADTFNNAIREVTPAGVISTVVNSAGPNASAPPAGGETQGPATASKLNGPEGVAVDDTTGNLYVADTSNGLVAAVSATAQPGTAAGPTAPAS